MRPLLSVGKQCTLGLAALLLLLSPAAALADDAVSPDPASTPAADTSTQTTDPAAEAAAAAAAAAAAKKAAAEAKVFHFNATTGMWENDSYIWDPATGKTTPKGTTPYTFQSDSGKWDTNDWHYDPASGSYKKYVPPPTPEPKNSDQTNNTLDSNTDANINNGLTSSALTGNASIIMNGQAGNALTGDASAVSNTINMLMSGVNFGNSVILPNTLVADIDGGIGDLTLDPSLLTMLQPASNCGCNANNTVNLQQSGQILNNISLDAGSGNALASTNGQVGDATSGSANAVANVINLANSSISAGGSFLGIINIHGDLNGDILLPQNLLEHILASNAPSTPTPSNQSSNLTANLNDTQNIENNIKAAASSGTATVAMNGQAGNATTGDASTNVTLLNLTGHQVVGSNSLLVFVNVLGSWMGLIMDAPAGTTAAELGGGNTTCACGGGNTEVNATNNTGITNNIDVNAHSGDATLYMNGQAGNATTGNASASVNLLNISGSQINLSDWFGVLFINVFGSWTGSFGVDTAAGNLPEDPKAGGQGGTQQGSASNTNTTTVTNTVFGLGSTTSTQEDQGEVQAAATTSDDDSDSGTTLGASTKAKTAIKHKSDWNLAISGLGISLCLVGCERLLALRDHRKKMGLA